MPDISNISGLRQLDKKRLHKKISFSEGEIIRAKASKLDGGKQIQLRTIDGWEFEGELEESVDLELNDKFLRFVIKGYKNGKLQLGIAEGITNQEDARSSIDVALEKMGIKKDKETVEILKLMMKLKMPLTKETLSNIKSVLQFHANINSNGKEKNNFINRFMESKGLNNQGEKTSVFKNELSTFLNKFSKLDMKSILFMMKNNISFKGENIDAFKNFNVGKNSIYDVVKDMSSFFDKDTLVDKDIDLSKFIERQEGMMRNESDTNKNTLRSAVNNYSSKDNTKMDFVEKMITDILKDSDGEDLKKLKELKDQIDFKEIEIKEGKEVSKEVTDNKKEVQGLKDKTLVITESTEKIKGSIGKMVKDAKEILKLILSEEKLDGNEELEKLQAFLDKNMSKLKVFNSISNEYYYYDGPLKYEEKEYPFQFIIKDDRKKEKKIDSKNVKIVVSLTTEFVGKIDAFIQIKDSNLNIDMKCDSKVKKFVELSTPKLMEKFQNSKYNIRITVEKRTEDVTILSSNEFFEDKSFAFLNTKV